jgi:hypothetical protein
MFVRHGPPTVDLAQADPQAKVEAFMLTVGSRFSASQRCDDKSHVAAGSDPHLEKLEGDWITRPRKKASHVFL